MTDFDVDAAAARLAGCRIDTADTAAVWLHDTLAQALDVIRRYEDGLRRLRDQDYDSGYDPEDYADCVLTGEEPAWGDVK